jgi:hypothetical protein
MALSLKTDSAENNSDFIAPKAHKEREKVFFFCPIR